MENSYPLTIADAASYLKISKGYLYQLAWYKKIPYYKPTGGKLYFKKEDLDAFAFRNRRDADFEKGTQPCS
jgi:excisionase family DNA binding protein